jgi:hypothetical protein
MAMQIVDIDTECNEQPSTSNIVGWAAIVRRFTAKRLLHNNATPTPQLAEAD